VKNRIIVFFGDAAERKRQEKLYLAADTREDAMEWCRHLTSAAKLKSLNLYSRIAAPHRSVVKEGPLDIVYQGADSFLSFNMRESGAITSCILFNDMMVYTAVTPKGLEFLGVIHVPSIRLIEDVPDAEGEEKQYTSSQHCFRVFGLSGDNHTCYSKSAAAKNDWLEQLKKQRSRLTEMMSVKFDHKDVKDAMEKRSVAVKRKADEQNFIHSRLSTETDELFTLEAEILSHQKKVDDANSGKHPVSNDVQKQWANIVKELIVAKNSTETDMKKLLGQLTAVNEEIARLRAERDDLGTFMEALSVE